MTKTRISAASALIAMALSSTAYAQSTDLENLYNLALQNDPLLSQANIQSEMAGEAVNATRSVWLPQLNSYFAALYLKDNRGLSAASSMAGNHFVAAQPWGTGYGANAGLNASQLIYSPAVKLAVDIARQDADSANLLLEKAQDALVLRTTKAYLDVLRAREIVKVAQANVDAIQEFKQQTELRVELGMASELDRQEAQAKFDTASAGIINAQALLETRLDALYSLTGARFDSVQPLDITRFDPSMPTPSYGTSWTEAAMSNNRDMQLAGNMVEKAKLQVRQASAGRQPSIIFTASLNHEMMLEVTELTGKEVPGGSISAPRTTELETGIIAQLPLYNGGRTSSMVKIAQHGYELAQTVNTQAQRGVLEAVSVAERFTNASLQSLHAYEQSLKSTQAALVAVEKGYEVGARTTAEVLAATGMVYAAQNEVNKARFDYIERAMTLKFIAGELSSDDISALNAGLVRQ